MEYYSMSLPTLASSAIIIVGLAFYLYRAALPRPIPGIPYYKPSSRHPLGDTLDLLQRIRQEGDIAGLLPIRIRQLNSPIVQIFLHPLGKPWVVVSDPQEANDVLAHRTREFDRSEQFKETFQTLLPHMHIHFSTGPDWKAHRRLIKDIMSSSFLREVAGPLFWASAQDMIKLWKIKLRLAQGRPFSVSRDIHSTALEVVWHATFGSEPGSTKAQIELLSGGQLILSLGSVDSAVDFPQAKNPAAFDSIMTLTDSLEIPINSIFPNVHHWLALKLSPKLVKSSKHKDRFLKEQMQISKEKISGLSADIQDDKHYTSAVDLILHREKTAAEKEGREPVYESKIIADELFGLLLAAHDTTSTTISWALKYLAADHSVQSKLRAMLQAAFTSVSSIDEQPTIEDIVSHDIPYLDAVMAEVHRKAATVVALSRTSVVDTTLFGHHIPKGTTVLFLNNGPGIQTPPFFVDDKKRSGTSLQAKGKYADWNPENIQDFIPERWLRTSSNGDEEFNPQAGLTLPFGAGPRACFGRKWAQLELRVILTLIVWNFELHPPPPNLASFKAFDKVTHQPQQCYVRLAGVNRQQSN